MFKKKYRRLYPVFFDGGREYMIPVEEIKNSSFRPLTKILRITIFVLILILI